jgi:hypothetical protein
MDYSKSAKDVTPAVFGEGPSTALPASPPSRIENEEMVFILKKKE